MAYAQQVLTSVWEDNANGQSRHCVGDLFFDGRRMTPGLKGKYWGNVHRGRRSFFSQATGRRMNTQIIEGPMKSSTMSSSVHQHRLN
jgi:hypothetical protein